MNCRTNGPICSSKVRSADIWGEGAKQELIGAYRTRHYQAKSGVCPSEVRHRKANDLVQEELMSLHHVLQPRMNIVLIVRCSRAIFHREAHRQRGSKVTSTRNNGDHRPVSPQRIWTYHARRFDWLDIRADFPQLLRSHRNHSRDKRRFNQILSIDEKAWIAAESLHRSPIFRRGC
jgi:hypothetical protein